VLVMTGAQGRAAAGGDEIRAGHADRERVIETLKDAFVHGRLTRDELGARVGEALAARTCADLAALTADIPAVPSVPAAAGTAWPPAPAPAPARSWPLARAAARSGGCLVLAAIAVWLAFLTNRNPGPDPYGSVAPGFLFMAYVAVVAALGCAAYGVFTSVEQRRSRRRLPPRPGPGAHAPRGEGRDGTGRDPVPPGSRAVQARARPRAHKSREQRHFPARTSRVRHGMRLVSGAT
jgi:hypothetical protein